MVLRDGTVHTYAYLVNTMVLRDGTVHTYEYLYIGYRGLGLTYRLTPSYTFPLKQKTHAQKKNTNIP